VQGLRRGPGEEVSLEQFANGRSPWIRYVRPGRFDADEVVRRARSRVGGEDRYRLLTNNCEHFCEWCLGAEHRSYHVDEWLCYFKPEPARITVISR
jgi:Lecithin retinol acyltransferase